MIHDYRVPAPVIVDGLVPESLILDMLQDYRTHHIPRLMGLRAAYIGDHPILHKLPKPEYKPDNRIVCNFPKQIVDTMVGYFLGVPITVTGDAQAVEWLDDWGRLNAVDDLDAELSKLCDIYGCAYEVMWRDAEARPRSSACSPLSCFMVRDDTVEGTPLFAVRFHDDRNRFDGEPDMVRGTVYTARYEIPFSVASKVVYGEPVEHGFPGVPVVEYVENTERIGIFEGVLSQVYAYEDAVSEKANDVDYYADAYLSVLGAEIDEDTLKALRDSRIINIKSPDAQAVTVQFLAKPEADTTQENLIDRLERLIFTLSMVADISDEDFGTSSGIAIKYKLQAMSDLALVKERKFRKGLTGRWHLLFGYAATTGVSPDAYLELTPVFTRNLPGNLLEESQIAANLAGIVSEETQLSVLSCVSSPREEMERKQDEMEQPLTRVVE